MVGPLKALQMDKKFLFICGCPRSGTTALWRLMVAHPRIVLGVERYVLFAQQKNKSLTPELYDKQKFFDLQPKETFYKNLVEFSRYYEMAEKRYDKALWIGDKIPFLFLKYANLEATMPGANIIFIVRNIIDVAGSYQRRADRGDPTWTPDKDYKQSIADWRQSIELTLQFIADKKRNIRVHIVSYEDLFLQAADLGPLFEKLGLDVSPQVQAQYEKLMEKSGELDARRGDALTSSNRQYISLHAPFDEYRRILEKRLVLSPAQSSLENSAQLSGS
jgi:hypothetical protein